MIGSPANRMASQSPANASAPTVARGSLLAYRTFDASDSVSLEDARALLLSAERGRASVEFRRPPRRELGALQESALPLCVELGPRRLDVAGAEVLCNASARLFDYGTISVTFELPIPELTTLSDVAELADALQESVALSTLAEAEYEGITQKIGPALSGRHPPAAVQSYVVVFIEQLEPALPPSVLLEWAELPKLVACERDGGLASEQQRQDLLRTTDAYRADDLVVIGSACALVLEPGGERDVPEVIELARAQLAQLVNYDAQLDRELSAAHRDLDRSALRVALYSPFSSTVRRLSRRRLELAAFTERVDSALKIVSDAYLARIYTKANERFALPDLKHRVAHKHRLLQEFYTALKDEVSMVRSVSLEVLIALMILLEVIFALTGH